MATARTRKPARQIVEAVDHSDPRPVWVTIWGGAADLAQALWTVRATRAPGEVERFVSKLRVYSISDPDDAGPWARAYFPNLFWITSIHGFNDYALSTWSGINAAAPVDQTQVSQPWLDKHIRSHGPLGAQYPAVVFGMEGDTPSFLYLIQNGLGSSEHPDWGSWGGRYAQIADFLGLWASATDRVTGAGGLLGSNQATISRWRSAYQNDFAARMDWSVQRRFAGANHPPQVRLNAVAGHAPVVIEACAGDKVRLSARGTSDPDRQALTHRWWQYREASAGFAPSLGLNPQEGFETTIVTRHAVQRSDMPMPAAQQVHVILEVTYSGAPALTRYRRALINILTSGAVAGRPCPAPPMRAPAPFTDEHAGGTPPVGAPFNGVLSARSAVGVLLDNPAAVAVLDRHMPSFSSTPGLAGARGMPLRLLQDYVPGMTDETLAAIDAELAQLPPGWQRKIRSD